MLLNTVFQAFGPTNVHYAKSLLPSGALLSPIAWKFTEWPTPTTTNKDDQRYTDIRKQLSLCRYGLTYTMHFPDVCMWGLRPHHTGAWIALLAPEGEPSLQSSTSQILRQTPLQVQQLELCQFAFASQLKPPPPLILKCYILLLLYHGMENKAIQKNFNKHWA